MSCTRTQGHAAHLPVSAQSTAPQEEAAARLQGPGPWLSTEPAGGAAKRLPLLLLQRSEDRSDWPAVREGWPSSAAQAGVQCTGSGQHHSLPVVVPHLSDNMVPDELRPQAPDSSPGQGTAKLPPEVWCHLKQGCEASKTRGGARCGDQHSWCLQAGTPGPKAGSHAPGHSCQAQNGKRSMLGRAGIQQHLYSSVRQVKQGGHTCGLTHQHKVHTSCCMQLATDGWQCWRLTDGRPLTAARSHSCGEARQVASSSCSACCAAAAGFPAMQLLTAATVVRPSSRLPTTFCSTCRRLNVVTWWLCCGPSQQRGPALGCSGGCMSDVRRCVQTCGLQAHGRRHSPHQAGAASQGRAMVGGCSPSALPSWQPTGSGRLQIGRWQDMQGSAQAGPWLLPQRSWRHQHLHSSLCGLRLCGTATQRLPLGRCGAELGRTQLPGARCGSLHRNSAQCWPEPQFPSCCPPICRPHAGTIEVLTPGAGHLTCLVASAGSLIHAAAHPPQHGGGLHVVEGVPQCWLLLSPAVQLHLQPH